MSDFINVSLGASSNASFSLAAYNNGREDPNLYFKIRNTSGFTIQPQETVRALIVPKSDGMTALEASGLLADPNSTNDVSRGIYYSRYYNDQNQEKTLTDMPLIRLDGYTYENVEFELYWLQSLADGVIFDSDTAGVYSFPHNIQPQEVRVGLQLIDNNTTMRYTLNFSEFNNIGDANYAGNNLPYLLSILYRYDPYRTGVVSGVVDGSTILFSGAFDWEPLPSGSNSGLVIDLPFYDTRAQYDGTPAQYSILLNNNCADPTITGSYPFVLSLNQQDLADQQLIDLDTYITTNIIPDNIRRVGEVPVDEGTITRKRLSIGINDIAIRQNTYRRKGVYVSKPYTTDFSIYTFSLKVDEFIPDYPEVNPYDTVKYFIEFNSRPWEPISPIHRQNELNNDGMLLPKLFVFDKGPEDALDLENIKYLDYGASINMFRVKIVFDLSNVPQTQFIAPEIRDYTCILFDKTQLLEL